MFKGFKELITITSVFVILWFIECFYFILNDRVYGTAGAGLFILVVIQAIIIVVAFLYAHDELERLDRLRRKKDD